MKRKKENPKKNETGKKDSGKKMKMSLWLIVLLVVCVFLWFLNKLQSRPIGVQKKLDHFVTEFNQLALPPGSQQIGKTFSDFGLLFGAGNHCGYYVSKLVQSTLSENELKNYYSKLHISAVDPNEYNEGYGGGKRGSRRNLISVIPLNQSQFYLENSYYKIAENHVVNLDVLDESVFLVSAADIGYRPRYLICH